MCMCANERWSESGGLLSTWMPIVVMENTLIRLDVELLQHLNATWTNTVANGHIIANSCRVLLVDFVDTIVHAFVYLEVEVWT